MSIFVLYLINRAPPVRLLSIRHHPSDPPVERDAHATAHLVVREVADPRQWHELPIELVETLGGVPCASTCRIWMKKIILV